jgi:hypothetical protein
MRSQVVRRLPAVDRTATNLQRKARGQSQKPTAYIGQKLCYFCEPKRTPTMHNDPELNGKYLGTISRDFVKVADNLKEASYQIRKRGFSDYPVFPVCKTPQPIGQLLIDQKEMQTEWNYYAAYLDEFVQRGILEDETDFKDAYKDPEEFCCLFVVDKEFTNFVFIPYPED